MTEQAGPLEVHKAIVAVAAELSGVGIGKDHRNTEQKFNFRGIDDVLNTLSPLLAKHQLFLIPNVLERAVTEGKTKSGGTMWRIALKVEYRITSAKDGSHVTGLTYAEAMDSADKATNKALSAAYKYFAIQAFAIPVVGTPDADAESPEPFQANSSASNKAPRRPPPPDVITLEDVRAAIAGGAMSTNAMADRLSLQSQAENDALLSGLTDSENDIISAAWPQ